MNRRNVLKGAAAMTLPVGALADAQEQPRIDYEAKYWEAQRHIDELYKILSQPITLVNSDVPDDISMWTGNWKVKV